LTCFTLRPKIANSTLRKIYILIKIKIQ